MIVILPEIYTLNICNTLAGYDLTVFIIIPLIYVIVFGILINAVRLPVIVMEITALCGDILIICHGELENPEEHKLYEDLRKSPYRNYIKREPNTDDGIFFLTLPDKSEKIHNFRKKGFGIMPITPLFPTLLQQARLTLSALTSQFLLHTKPMSAITYPNLCIAEN